MANITARVLSEQLGFATTIKAIIPEHSEKNQKVLYLLHGLSDDCTAWTRYTRIESYAAKYSYTVIMPEVQRSFYSDMKYGSNYFSYITKELPVICKKLFGIKPMRENTFVAGLSMGGYGALKCALTYPMQYAACASFSGAVNMAGILADYAANNDVYKELPAILGKNNTASLPNSMDIFKLAQSVSGKKIKPRILVTCGTEDFLLEDNRNLDAYMKTAGYDYEYHEWGGAHNWDFWEECLIKMFNYFN